MEQIRHDHGYIESFEEAVGGGWSHGTTVKYVSKKFAVSAKFVKHL